MKKLLYIALITVASSIAITSCTEEDVAPVANDTNITTNNGGGGTSGPGPL